MSAFIGIFLLTIPQIVMSQTYHFDTAAPLIFNYSCGGSSANNVDYYLVFQPHNDTLLLQTHQEKCDLSICYYYKDLFYVDNGEGMTKTVKMSSSLLGERQAFEIKTKYPVAFKGTITCQYQPFSSSEDTKEMLYGVLFGVFLPVVCLYFCLWFCRDCPWCRTRNTRYEIEEDRKAVDTKTEMNQLPIQLPTI